MCVHVYTGEKENTYRDTRTYVCNYTEEYNYVDEQLTGVSEQEWLRFDSGPTFYVIKPLMLRLLLAGASHSLYSQDFSGLMLSQSLNSGNDTPA